MFDVSMSNALRKQLRLFAGFLQRQNETTIDLHPMSSSFTGRNVQSGVVLSSIDAYYNVINAKRCLEAPKAVEKFQHVTFDGLKKMIA
jgi:hypothetical protein